MAEKPVSKNKIYVDGKEVYHPELLSFLDGLFERSENEEEHVDGDDDWLYNEANQEQEQEEGDDLFIIGKKLLEDSGIYSEDW